MASFRLELSRAACRALRLASEQRLEAGDFWIAVLELVSGHPYLCKRAAALQELANPGTVPAVGRNVFAYPLAPFLGVLAAPAGAAGGAMAIIAIIGVLEAIAIPSFIKHQSIAAEAALRARRRGRCGTPSCSSCSARTRPLHRTTRSQRRSREVAAAALVLVAALASRRAEACSCVRAGFGGGPAPGATGVPRNARVWISADAGAPLLRDGSGHDVPLHRTSLAHAFGTVAILTPDALPSLPTPRTPSWLEGSRPSASRPAPPS